MDHKARDDHRNVIPLASLKRDLDVDKRIFDRLRKVLIDYAKLALTFVHFLWDLINYFISSLQIQVKESAAMKRHS